MCTKVLCVGVPFTVSYIDSTITLKLVFTSISSYILYLKKWEGR